MLRDTPAWAFRRSPRRRMRACPYRPKSDDPQLRAYLATCPQVGSCPSSPQPSPAPRPPPPTTFTDTTKDARGPPTGITWRRKVPPMAGRRPRPTIVEVEWGGRGHDMPPKRRRRGWPRKKASSTAAETAQKLFAVLDNVHLECFDTRNERTEVAPSPPQRSPQPPEAPRARRKRCATPRYVPQTCWQQAAAPRQTRRTPTQWQTGVRRGPRPEE